METIKMSQEKLIINIQKNFLKFLQKIKMLFNNIYFIVKKSFEKKKILNVKK